MKSSQRFEFIDQLRAIAVVLVLINHIAEVYVKLVNPQKHHWQWLDYWSHEYNFGRIGVTIFFIVSGFVIPSSLKGPIGSGAQHFLVSRFFRLFPLFWFSILVALPTQNWSADKYPSIETILYNATMLPELFGKEMINNAYWTLAIELLFYGLTLLLFLVGLLRNQIVLSVLCIVCGLAFVDQEYRHQISLLEGRTGETIMLLGFMFWGALCRIRFDNGKLHPFAEAAFVLFAAGWLVAYPLAGFHEAHIRFHAEPDMVPRLYGSYFLSMVIFSAFYWKIRVSSAPLSYLGKISYSIYLMQGPVIFGVLYLIEHLFPSLSGRLPLYVSFPVISILTIAVSAATYAFVERPAQNMSSKISRKLRERSEAKAGLA